MRLRLSQPLQSRVSHRRRRRMTTEECLSPGALSTLRMASLPAGQARTDPPDELADVCQDADAKPAVLAIGSDR